MKIQILVDNRAEDGFAAEHGFALWIEAGGEKILLDTGAGKALPVNQERLGIDFAQANALVLSHGHYDHTGGIGAFLADNQTAVVYAAPGFDRPRFSCRPGEKARAIGLQAEGRRQIQALPPERFHLVTEPQRLAPRIGLTGSIPRVCPFEDPGGPFFFDAEATLPDPIEEDQALWFETADGLVILTGCCHAGLVNTIERIRDLTGQSRIHSIIGGFHLLNASEERLAQTFAALQDWSPALILPCHCTGNQVMDRLCAHFGSETVRPGQVGTILPLDAPEGL